MNGIVIQIGNMKNRYGNSKEKRIRCRLTDKETDTVYQLKTKVKEGFKTPDEVLLDPVEYAPKDQYIPLKVSKYEKIYIQKAANDAYKLGLIKSPGISTYLRYLGLRYANKIELIKELTYHDKTQQKWYDKGNEKRPNIL